MLNSCHGAFSKAVTIFWNLDLTLVNVKLDVYNKNFSDKRFCVNCGQLAIRGPIRRPKLRILHVTWMKTQKRMRLQRKGYLYDNSLQPKMSSASNCLRNSIAVAEHAGSYFRETGWIRLDTALLGLVVVRH